MLIAETAGMDSEMRSPLVGALAGMAATAAMTLAMGALFRRLPVRDRYPLPPREITTRVTNAAGLELAERRQVEATLASHFGYGAAAGALYPLLVRRPTLPTGIAFGLAVWAASYLGWLPATRILRPATRHPGRRNALMLLAHVVWGGATALVADGLDEAARTAFKNGEMRDAAAG